MAGESPFDGGWGSRSVKDFLRLLWASAQDLRTEYRAEAGMGMVLAFQPSRPGPVSAIGNPRRAGGPEAEELGPSPSPSSPQLPRSLVTDRATATDQSPKPAAETATGATSRISSLPTTTSRA